VRNALIIVLFASACTPAEEVINCPANAPIYDPVKNECRGATPTCGDDQELDSSTGQCVDQQSVNCPPGTPVYNPNTQSCEEEGGAADAGGTMSDAGNLSDAGAEDTGPLVAEDAGSQDIKIDGTCNPLVDPMDRRVGFPCNDHAQCGTCYCHDEAYMSPNRFCTKNCSSGAGSSCSDESDDPNEYVCLKFAAAQVNDYDLSVGGLCMPRCGSDAECKTYGPDYICPPKSVGTKWDEYTVQVNTTCQIP
jgi:hypothetical protein